MYQRLASAILLYSIIITLFGCASSPKKSHASDAAAASGANESEMLEKAKNDSAPDAKEFAAMDAEYRKHGYDAVIKRSRAFAKAYPKSEYLDETLNLRALAFIGLKQYQNAAIVLKKLIELSQNDALKNMAAYNLAYTNFELGQMDAASQALEQMKPSSLEKGDRMKYFILRAKISRLKQDYADAAQQILSALRSAPEQQGPMVDSMVGFLDEVLEPINNAVVIDKLLSDFDDVPGADRLLYKDAIYSFSNGDRDKAKKLSRRSSTRIPRAATTRPRATASESSSSRGSSIRAASASC